MGCIREEVCNKEKSIPERIHYSLTKMLKAFIFRTKHMLSLLITLLEVGSGISTDFDNFNNL